jgi:aromatic-L-amino-acid decarboxylase
MIRVLQERDIDAVVQLHGELSAKLFLDVEPSSFHETSRKLLAAVQPQWLSFVACIDETVVGFFIAHDWAIADVVPSRVVDPSQLAVRALVGELHAALADRFVPADRSLCRGEVVHAQFAGVAKSAQRRGILTRLFAETERVSRERGFVAMAAECIGVASLASWLKQGAAIVAEADLRERFPELANERAAAVVRWLAPSGDLRTAPAPLLSDPTHDGFSLAGRALVERAAQLVARFHAAPPPSVMLSAADAAVAAKSGELADTVREEPTSIERTFAELERVFGAAMLNPQHGGMMSYVPGGGLAASAVGDFLAAGINRNLLSFAVSPALVALELDVLRWFGSLVGFPTSTCAGHFTTGGSMSMWAATFAALQRARVGAAPNAQLVAYVGRSAHHAIAKAWHMCGMSDDSLRHVGVLSCSEGLAIDVAALRQCIAADTAAGHRAAVVFCTAGSTFTGGIDDIGALADVCAQYGAWLHVDAAYGGGFLLTERGRAALAGIERADSITVDAHKALFTPLGKALLLVRDQSALAAPFSGRTAGYLTIDSTAVDFHDIGPELSRPFRALSLWLPLRLYGASGIRRMLDDRLDWARSAAARLAQLRVGALSLRLVTPPTLSIVTFSTVVDGGSDDDETGRLNAALVAAIIAQGEVLPHCVRLPSVPHAVARVCILSAMTTAQHVDDLVRTTRWALERIQRA